MRRRVAWLLIVAGVVVVGVAIARPMVLAVLLLGGAVLLGGGMLLLPLPDVLADHPDEEGPRAPVVPFPGATMSRVDQGWDLDEEDRRRRGAAGWQKPVAPPRPEDLPGGLPPRRER